LGCVGNEDRDPVVHSKAVICSIEELAKQVSGAGNVVHVQPQADVVVFF
jgi:hypothetical protein